MKIEKYTARGRTLYRFRAYVGLDPATGQPIRVKKSGFETKKEAQLAYAEIVAHEAPSRARDMTVAQLYDVWMDTYRIGVKDSTLRHVKQIFRDHILPEFGRMKVADLTPIMLQEFVNEQASAADSGRRRFAYLAKLLRFAENQGVIESNPARRVTVPKVKKKAVRSQDMNVYTKEELERFLELAEEHLSPMWYAFFRLLAYTGMRRGEALALMWSDVDPHAMTVSITKTVTRGDNGPYISPTPKTDKSNRVIMIDPETMRLLQELPHGYDLVFPNTKGTIITLSQPVRQLHKAVDGTELKYISPHGLRHTHCSLLFSAGVSIPEVQDRLGHEDVKTTIDIYNHVYQSDRSDALNRFMKFMND